MLECLIDIAMVFPTFIISSMVLRSIQLSCNLFQDLLIIRSAIHNYLFHQLLSIVKEFDLWIVPSHMDVMMLRVLLKILEGLISLLCLQYFTNFLHFVSLMSQDHLDVFENIVLCFVPKQYFFLYNSKVIGSQFVLDFFGNQVSQALIVSRIGFVS